MKILVSNDDGVFAPGLKILANSLSEIGKVVVVAPMEERSTMGHSLTLHKPLRLNKIDDNFYGVSGSPADCVYVGMKEVLKGKPDLVISGPNRGANLGQDVYYSGTVSAAREACILGIPSLALSVDVVHTSKKSKREIAVRYDVASNQLIKFIKTYKKNLKELCRQTLININVPNLSENKLQGFRFTRMGFRYYSGDVLRRMDHRGRPYFWVGGQYKGYQDVPGTDCEAVANRYVSVTPIHLDCTNHRLLESLLKREF